LICQPFSIVKAQRDWKKKFLDAKETRMDAEKRFEREKKKTETRIKCEIEDVGLLFCKSDFGFRNQIKTIRKAKLKNVFLDLEDVTLINHTNTIL